MYATIIAAMIAATSAMLSPIITQIITQHGAYKLKTIELFFAAKEKAYRDYVAVTSEFSSSSGYEGIRKLNNVMNQALLFSSKETGQALALYVQLLRERENPDLDAIADAHLNALLAMQAELKQYHH